jgi:tetratricopeptide (TPR) repeat protein
VIGQPDLLLAVCSALRDRIDLSAGAVFSETSELYAAMAKPEREIGAFDEKEYFLGETALLAGTSARVLGKRSESELWLDRSEAGFRHTINPSPLLASVTYQRLALRCESGRYAEVVELAPLLASSFKKLGMLREESKCHFLEGLALKQSGDHEAAIAKFESVCAAMRSLGEPSLVSLALINLADIRAAEGDDELALVAYNEAIPLLEKANRPTTIAHLQGVVGETLRRQGRLVPAIEAYRAAIRTYAALEMSTWVAYLRVVLAQTLLQAGQHREAEWEILAALPTIDEQGMVPEGFAAVALLRESVRQRKTDPKALLELREYLQAKN